MYGYKKWIDARARSHRRYAAHTYLTRMYVNVRMHDAHCRSFRTSAHVHISRRNALSSSSHVSVLKHHDIVQSVLVASLPHLLMMTRHILTALGGTCWSRSFRESRDEMDACGDPLMRVLSAMPSRHACTMRMPVSMPVLLPTVHSMHPHRPHRGSRRRRSGKRASSQRR